MIIKSKITLAICAALIAVGCAGGANLLKNPAAAVGDLVKSGGTSSSSTGDGLIGTVKNLNAATKDFTEAEEIQLGEEMLSTVLGAVPLYGDDRVQRYVNQVGRWIASHSERPNLPWRFVVINSDLVSAGAAPGGQIYISSGLLKLMRSEAELAGALAHEIAHVVQKHQLTAFKTKSGWNAAASGLSTFADTKLKSTPGKEIVKFGLGEIKTMLLLALDRSEEEQADRMGMTLAARAGYDPYGLPAVIQVIQDASTQSAESILYATHPAPADRLASLDQNFGTSMEKYANQAKLPDRFSSIVLGRTSTTATQPAPAKQAPAPAPKKKP